MCLIRDVLQGVGPPGAGLDTPATGQHCVPVTYLNQKRHILSAGQLAASLLSGYVMSPRKNVPSEIK